MQVEEGGGGRGWEERLTLMQRKTQRHTAKHETPKKIGSNPVEVLFQSLGILHLYHHTWKHHRRECYCGLALQHACPRESRLSCMHKRALTRVPVRVSERVCE